MKISKAVQSISNWDAASLGMGTQANVKLDFGPLDLEGEIFCSSVTHGSDGGVIYFNNSLVEAVGICARGTRDGFNEDALGVCENEDGSVLFSVADGLHAEDDTNQPTGGVEASSEVMLWMTESASYQRHFDTDCAEDVQDGLEVPTGAGAAYAGVKIFSDINPEIGLVDSHIVTIGDCRVICAADSKLVMETHSHNRAYEKSLERMRRVDDPIKLRDKLRVQLADNKDALTWLAGMESYDSNTLRGGRRFCGAMHRFLQYTFPSNVIYSCFGGEAGGAKFDPRSDWAEQQSGRQFFVYSDGVGDLFTPVDIAKAFHGTGKPLHEQALRFAERIVLAQIKGRRVDVGVGNKIRVDANSDNYAFWAIKVK